MFTELSWLINDNNKSLTHENEIIGIIKLLQIYYNNEVQNTTLFVIPLNIGYRTLLIIKEYTTKIRLQKECRLETWY